MMRSCVRVNYAKAEKTSIKPIKLSSVLAFGQKWTQKLTILHQTWIFRGPNAVSKLSNHYNHTDSIYTYSCKRMISCDKNICSLVFRVSRKHWPRIFISMADFIKWFPHQHRTNRPSNIKHSFIGRFWCSSTFSQTACLTLIRIDIKIIINEAATTTHDATDDYNSDDNIFSTFYLCSLCSCSSGGRKNVGEVIKWCQHISKR